MAGLDTVVTGKCRGGQRGPARRKLTASPPAVSHSRATARPSRCTAHACCKHVGLGVRMALAVIPGLGWPKQNLCIPGDGGGSPYGGRPKPPGIGFGGPGGACSPSAAEPGPGCGPIFCAAVRHGLDLEASGGQATNGDAGSCGSKCRGEHPLPPARQTLLPFRVRTRRAASSVGRRAQRASQLQAAPRMVEEEDGGQSRVKFRVRTGAPYGGCPTAFVEGPLVGPVASRASAASGGGSAALAGCQPRVC